MKKTSIPGTTFVECPEYEKLRIANHCAILASGFYRRRAYLVLPKIVPQYASRCVVIPEFVSQLSREFWVGAIEAGKTMPIGLTEGMKKEIEKYEVEMVDRDVVDRFKSEWECYQTRYWEILGELMPDKVKWIGSVEVRITKYATQSSFYLLKKKHNQNLIIHLREDADIGKLARIIIMALLWPDRETMGLTWSKRVAVTDYLMSLSPIRSLFGKTKSTLVQKPISAIWVEKSEQYLAFLRVPQVLQSIDLIRQHINMFGDKERAILMKIVEAKGEIVTQDEIADLQWGEGEFGSFWAMNKIIQRIRRKLEKIGVDSVKLKPLRGHGYWWNE